MRPSFAWPSLVSIAALAPSCAALLILLSGLAWTTPAAAQPQSGDTSNTTVPVKIPVETIPLEPPAPAAAAEAPRTEEPAAELPPTTHEGLRVALLVPLSGPNAALGNWLSNAAQLALFDTESVKLELLPLDTKGTAQGAAAAMDQALDQGVDIVLGPVLSAEVKAAAPAARRRGVPILAFTTDRSALSPGVFTLGFLPEIQAKALIAQALAEGRKRLAVLAPDTDFGHAMAEAFKTMAASSGAEVKKVQFYPPDQTDFRALAQSFADYGDRKAALAHDRTILSGRDKSATGSDAARMPYDAVLLPDEGVRLKNLVSLLTYYGLDPGPVKFMGTLRWSDPALTNEPTLEGAWYPAPPESPLTSFETHYTKSFGALPKSMVSFAAAAYDGMALTALLSRKGPGAVSLVNLLDSQGYAGVDGLFRLMADGSSDRGLSIRELTHGGSREIAPAPEHFPEPLTEPGSAPSPH